jgi:hypothetical protein
MLETAKMPCVSFNGMFVERLFRAGRKGENVSRGEEQVGGQVGPEDALQGQGVILGTERVYLGGGHSGDGGRQQGLRVTELGFFFRAG